jgi:hypothetical protein
VDGCMFLSLLLVVLMVDCCGEGGGKKKQVTKYEFRLGCSSCKSELPFLS